VEHTPENLGSPSPREDLLDRVVEVYRRNGLDADLSLRTIAEQVGSSHRMLNYHFGSREGLLAAVLNELWRDHEAGLAIDVIGWSRREAILAFWSATIAPASEPHMRFFFHVFGQLVTEPDRDAELARPLATWIEELTVLGEHEGLPRETARDDARLTIACFRGLLMDLLVTGDREGATRALIRFLDVLEGRAATIRTAGRRSRA
jgi:AcrR family transcriptional regulator